MQNLNFNTSLNIIQLLKTTEMEFTKPEVSKNDGPSFKDFLSNAMEEKPVQEEPIKRESQVSERAKEEVRPEQDSPVTDKTSGTEENMKVEDQGKEEETLATEDKAVEQNQDETKTDETVENTEDKTEQTVVASPVLTEQDVDDIVNELLKELPKNADLSDEKTLKQLTEKLESKINEALQGKLEIKLEIRDGAKIQLELQNEEGKEKSASHNDAKKTTVDAAKINSIVDTVKDVLEKIENPLRDRNPEMKKSEKMSVEVVQLTTKNISDQQQNAQQQNMGNKNNDGDELADLRNLQNKSRKTSAAVKTGDQPVINNATISENKDFELNARILMSSRHQASGKIRTQGMDVLSRNVEQGQSKIESSDLGMKMKGGIGQSLERQSIFTENRPQAANRMPNMSPVEQTAETIRKSGKTSRLVLNLNPKDLGQVKLDLTVTGDRLQASFRADTTQAKESLQMNMHVLKEALAEKGFDVEKMDFNFSSREESFGESDQQKNEGQGSQGDKQQSKGQFGTNAMGEDIGNIDESDSEDLLAEAEAIAAEAVAEMSDRRVNIQA